MKLLFLSKCVTDSIFDLQEVFVKENLPPVLVENEKLLHLYLELAQHRLKSFFKNADCQGWKEDLRVLQRT